MMIDYVRVYQRTDSQNVGCDPKDYPTADYIEKHMEAYTSTCPFLHFRGGPVLMMWSVGNVDPQLKHWEANDDGAGYGQTFPRNEAVS